MKIKLTIRILFLVLGFSLAHEKLTAQSALSPYVLFSGPNGTGTTLIGSSITINGGTVAGYKLVQTTGNANIYSNIYSGDKIIITNSNVIRGNMAAANSSGSTGTVISIGSSVSILGNIDSKGNVVVAGGLVDGTVNVSPGTYSGPIPTNPIIGNNPQVPILPAMPAETTFPSLPLKSPFNGTTNQTATPGFSYPGITYSGNKTLTLMGPGVYVFDSLKWTGNSNNLIFDFNGQSGKFFIYVKKNADFGKPSVSIINGGNAASIYFEIHGNGSFTSIPGNSFIVANGSSGGGSKMDGTVYASRAGINIGSGTGSSLLTGAFYSPTSVSIQSGVTINYAPFDPCVPPQVKVTDDKPLNFVGQTTLTDSANASGVTRLWQATKGGVITSDPTLPTITVSAAGTYILTVTSATNSSCIAKDTTVVSAAVKNIIGSELLSIYQNYGTSNIGALDTFFAISGSYVKIDVVVFAGKRQQVLDTLVKPTYGLNNIYPSGQSPLTITGDFPITNLLKLNSLGSIINYCRPYYEPQTFSERDTLTGLVKSAGDTTMGTYLVRPGYRINGDGIKVGVISNSYNTILSSTTATPPFHPITGSPSDVPQEFNTNRASQDIANGDLPGDTLGSVNPNGYLKNVHVLQDLTFQSTDEGRAMLQIVHDVAPAAELYFRTGFFTPGDFATGITQLKNAGCKIIVDDITYITEPFLKDGIVANTVNTVKSQGVTYFSAAGNFANRSYEKDFNPIDATSIGFTNKKAHNFGGGDMFQKLRLAPGNYTFVFQWADDIYSIGETGGTQFNLDIFLTKNTDGTGLIGFNRDNLLGDPIEFIPITITGSSPTDSSDYNILIVNNTLTGNPSRIKYVVFRGGVRFMEYNEGTSTIVGQANATGAIAIGAARFNHVPGHPLLPPSLSGITKPQIESYSSVGGTYVNGSQRQKPDLVGPDGVNTTVKMGQDYPNEALDGFSNFFGTSAAAPHAAGAAALIMQGRKRFITGHPDTSPDEIKALFQLTAIEMRPPGLVGYDFSSGAGLIDADSAMRTFASPTPFQIQLVVPPGAIPGEAQFLLTVTGENFSTNSVIYINDSAITTVFVNEHELQATIGEFEGNPEIRAYTPPKTLFGDAGFSNSLFFFDANIVVQAVNITKKFGETMPALDTIITINGKLLQDTTLTLADIGLSNLTVQTTATTNSNVGTYTIDVNRIFDPNNLNDLEFLKKFNYKFIGGSVTIEQLPLTITVQNQTVNYGDQIPNIQFNYQFDQTNISNPSALLSQIQTTHLSQLAKDAQGHDILGLINAQAVTIFNGQALPVVKGQEVFYVNGQALTIFNGDTIPVVNGQALTIFNGVVTDTVGSDLSSSETNNLSFLASQSTLGNARSITNKTGITNVVDITQESILDFNVNGAQTQMLNSLSNVVPKGLVDQPSYANGQALTIFNGQALTIFNGQALTIFNGQAVAIFNGQAVVIFNGDTIPVVNSDNRTAVIVNATEIGGGINPLKSLNIISGLDAGDQFILPGAFTNTNYNVTIVPGTLHINKAILQVKADNKTKPYGDENPALTVTYNGFVYGENFETSDITGAPALSTTATTTSPVSPPTYPIVPSAGTLTSSNYSFSFVNGALTVVPNACLLTHSPGKNFGTTTKKETSLWVNVTTKVSGQLNANGKYLLFKAGSIMLNNIKYTLINNSSLTIPDGIIIAKDTATAPWTRFDLTKKMWITTIPVSFASTSDLFLTGAIISSSIGFSKTNNDPNTSVSGIFYSNATFTDQWTYAMATYQPTFTYDQVDEIGQVVAINGTYRAGTPLSIIVSGLASLVPGGSGGGGNNYTGSTLNWEKFTACSYDAIMTNRSINPAVTQSESQPESSKSSIAINPNPASNFITINFVPAQTGNSKIEIYSIHGKKVFEMNNGVCHANQKYQQRIDIGKFPAGIYLVQIKNEGQVTNKKFVIAR